LRRAGVPMVFSQGFNPRPRIQFASPLPLGFTSECEIVDVWVSEDSPNLDQIKEELCRSLPPGLVISKIYTINENEPALQTVVRSAVYLVTLLEPVQGIGDRVKSLLSELNLVRNRRGQDYNLRPLIKSLELVPALENEYQQIRMELSAQEGRTGRPEEVLAALGISAEKVLIKRERLVFESNNRNHSW